MQIAILNDKILPYEEVGHEYLDRGLFFGDGVYEVIRSYDGRIFALDEHIERFSASLKAIEITKVDINQVRDKIILAFAKSNIPNACIYFHITRGSGPRNHAGTDDLEPNFFLTVKELEDDTKMKTEGISVITYPDQRWKRCDIKSLNLLPNVMAKREAAKRDAFEAIFVNDEGFITEGSSSAFFAIHQKKLQTSPLSANILPSITRKFVVKAAANISLEIVDNSLTPQQAALCDELFIAVTTKDIVPVVKFDDKIIGDGNPGQYTKALAEEFRKFTIL
ncbi:MAG: aminotransferase class IV [Sedimentisphaerales bacterium]|nr:aminotransferase class IV [Sedimentisphaerales bacterium]